MSKITFRITKKGLVFRKGSARLTIPAEGEYDRETRRRRKIYFVSDEVAGRIRPGVARIRHLERSGTVSSEPVYRKYVNYGFWYAEVKWDDGAAETFNLNKMGIEVEL